MTACRFTSKTTPRVLVGRHDTTCDGTDCAGCLPCPDTHCAICHRVHVQTGACPECTAAVRDDLRSIAQLVGALPTETIHRGVNSEAAMLWGPTADPEAWRNRATSAMFGRLPAGYLDDNRDEAHPLWVLGTWEQTWRQHLNQPTDLNVTLPRVVDYLDRRMSLMSHVDDPPFDDFARDLRSCRAHLQAVLADGNQGDRANIGCFECGADIERKLRAKPRCEHRTPARKWMALLETYPEVPTYWHERTAAAHPCDACGPEQGGFEDVWTCRKCRRTYTYAEYNFALRAHLEKAQEANA